MVVCVCVCVNYSIKLIRCFNLHTLMPFQPFSLPRNAKEASLKMLTRCFSTYETGPNTQSNR